MNSPSFQLNKIKRLISYQGRVFNFMRPTLNEFKEPTGEGDIISIKGVYHETTGHMVKSSTESTTIRQRPSPMVLCLWSDAEKLNHTDILILSGRIFRICEIKNLEEADIAADISLEEVQNG